LSINSINVSTRLILDYTAYGEDESIVFLSADSIDLIEDVAEIVKDVHVYDVSHRVLHRAEHYCRADNVHFHSDVFPPPDAVFDTAILLVPKGRDFARAQLWSTLHALKENGIAYIAGPNKGGAKTMIKDSKQLFGEVNVLGYRSSHRVAAAIKQTPPQTYPAKWGDIPTQTQHRTFKTPHGALEVATMPGLFSWQKLDDGTRYLLEHVTFEAGQAVLDVGCGNGVIGALAAPVAESVVMVDDNLLAIRCARETVALHDYENVTVHAGNVYKPVTDSRFDLIISNPPFHRKFDVSTNVAHQLINGAKEHLNPGGRLLIVANEFLRYDALMDEQLSGVRVLARNNRFKVIEGRRG
jgi:16S rRNA (guanine1207-N2)-methyltransferase